MSSGTDRQSARGAYHWLRASPLLTIPTLIYLWQFGAALPCSIYDRLCGGYRYEFLSGAIFGIFGSSLWHLILLQYIKNKNSEFIRKHGRQAFKYAVIRTALVFLMVMLGLITDMEELSLWVIPILVGLWIANSYNGYREIDKELGIPIGKSHPAQPFTHMESAMPENDPRSREEILEEILMELQSDDDVVCLKAIMRLNLIKDSNEAILNELEKLADNDKNMDIRLDARVAFDKLKNKDMPQEIVIIESSDSEPKQTEAIQFKSNEPHDVLQAILEGLKSEFPGKRLSAIRELQNIKYSSEAIRSQLEKISLHDKKDDIRKEALAALDLASQRFIRSRINKIDRGNRHLLIQEIADWEKLGLLEKHHADVLRRRYDFDLTPPPAPKPAPAPKAVSAPVPLKASPPVLVTTSQPVQAQPAPVAAKPAPAPAPKPKQPPVDWKKVRQRIGEAASSGALLRALLYLGAFMIVISATVLVIRFWSAFNPILQLLFIASVPLIFYAGGWILRTRVKLTQAGTVLTGIGAVLVAVDFAAIYQLGGLAQQVNGPIYWLGVAVFCTILYAFTSWKIQGEFFDYLTLIAGSAIFFAATRVVKAPIEWSVVSVTASAAIMAAVAARRSQSGSDFGRASRYLSQILIPASIVFILYSKADAPTMAAFLLATIAYSVFAWKFPSIVFAYSALAASVGMVLFGLRAFEVSPNWYGTVGAVLALVYILIGQFAKQAKIETPIIRSYVRALDTTGFLMIGLAAIDGFYVAFSPQIWPGIIALTIASLDLAICAYLFHHSRYTLLASGLFLAPFTFAVTKILHNAEISQQITWLTAAWGSLALVYVALAAFLRKAEHHARWIYAWAHVLIPFALFFIYIDYLAAEAWVNTSALVSLAICISGYLATFILQDSGKHPTLSTISNLLPLGAGKALFLWPIGLLLPIFASILWSGTELPREWFGAALAGFVLAYLGAGQVLFKRAKEYRFPFHVFVYLLCLIAIPLASANRYAFLTSLLITVISSSVLAYLYNRVLETAIASLLFILPFQISLEIFEVSPYAQGLAYALLSSIVYVPIAIYLNKFEKSRERLHPLPVFFVGYSFTVYAVAASLIGRASATFTPWVGAAIPLLAAALFTYSTSYFKENKFAFGWAWASALTFAIAFGQSLTLFKLAPVYHTLAWAGFAFVYMFAEQALKAGAQKIERYWFENFRWPLIAGTITLALIGFALSLSPTFKAFSGTPLTNYQSPILAQSLLVALLIVSARLYKQAWTLFLEPFLAFLPVTLFFVGYGKGIFNQSLTTPQYALIWTGLGAIHLLAGIFTDRAKIRYAYGPYLGAYALMTWAVLWSAIDRAVLVWSLGLWLGALIGSAALVHFGRHQTWIELNQMVFGKSKGFIQTSAYNAFQWLAEWIFPIWLILLLRQINVQADFAWLGLVVPPLAYLGLALWFEKIDHAYTVPLHTSSQFYTAVALLISAPFTVTHLTGDFLLTEDKTSLFAFIVLQTLAVIFYAASSWRLSQRRFAHIASWLSFFPYTLAWITYNPALATFKFALPWLGLAAVLLLIGYALDKNKVRYSQGPYLAGYVLALFALTFSALDRLTNIYVLSGTIILAVISYLLVHFGRHHSFEDFIHRFWKKANVSQQVASTIFLFFASYAAPFLLAQILTHLELELSIRGALLAVSAPLFIAIGLAVRNTKSRSLYTVPTWPLYSAGYALTAIGAMISFGDERLAIYVLVLNTIVYAVSAYIFQQTFWLYLSTVLTPIIALLILHHTDHLQNNWAAWIFIGLAYLYFAIGQIFDQNKKSENEIHPFAAPFYAPGFILSAVALAVSSSDKMLALQIYSAGVVFYAIAGWRFREPLFIYPASWLATVPYFLAVTLTPLETRWYGLAWLPLIILYIGFGKFIFHKESLPPLGRGVLIKWLSHPAVPFYLLAYSLSVSMISLSYVSPLALTLAFGAAAVIYLTSAYLFQAPSWIYAGLFATHMTVLAYFTINPSGRPAHYITYPFLAMTWLTALFGYGVSRRITEPASSLKNDAFQFSLINRLFGHVWARPFFAFAILEMFIWQTVAIKGYDTTIILGSGHALLLALFSLLWAEGVLVYGVVGFGLLAMGAWMKQSGIVFTDAVAIYGGIGFGLYLLARLLEPLSTRIKALTVWLVPLTYSAVTLTAASVVINLPFVISHMTATAASMAFAGALYVAIAYRGRRYQLGYLGMALLEIAWAMAMYMNDVSQPQWYAIPGGLYFMGLAYLEWQRNKSRYAIGIEILGLGILLITSFIQSVNGENGFPYFVILMIESLLVIGWGTIQKRKIPFFTGIVSTALNFIAQVILLVNAGIINIWYVGLGTGLLIVGIAVFVELRREQLRARIGEWTEALEHWE
ncbi:MAG: hypothetical protein HY863_12435 [Chloroflexi bacterium]|nr:hypothetical protein [Chloroflexota bacterium]